MNIYKVFKKQIAFELKDKHNISWIDTEPNYNVPNFRVFLFEDTPRFREVFSKISN